MSASKFSGKPDALPSQSRPERAESEALRFVGPAGIGAAAVVTAVEPGAALLLTVVPAEAAATAGFA